MDEAAHRQRAAAPTLIFDGDCEFCTSIAKFARRRLPQHVRVVPWQLIEDPAAVGLTAETIGEMVWWIDVEGRPHPGHQAFAEGARSLRGAWSILGTTSTGLFRIPILDRLGARAYAVIARNRGRLPGSTPACRQPARSTQDLG